MTRGRTARESGGPTPKRFLGRLHAGGDGAREMAANRHGERVHPLAHSVSPRAGEEQHPRSRRAYLMCGDQSKFSVEQSRGDGGLATGQVQQLGPATSSTDRPSIRCSLRGCPPVSPTGAWGWPSAGGRENRMESRPRWTSASSGRPRHFSRFRHGSIRVTSGTRCSAPPAPGR